MNVDEFMVTSRATTPETEPCPECLSETVILETGYREVGPDVHIPGCQYRCATCGWVATNFPVH